MLVDRYIFQKHLEEGEEIRFVCHKHWTQFFGPVLNVIFFGFMLPWVFYFIGFKAAWAVVLIFLWMFIGLIKLFYDWIDWYSDVWLFTNMSIIVVEWHGIFSNTSQRVGYEDVEGLSFAIRGFWGTVMRFGDATLKVISGSHVTMENSRRPKEIELALMKHQADYLNDRNLSHSDGLKDMLSQMVAHHIRRKR